MRQTGEQWLSQFMDYLTGERGYSTRTISNYAIDLNQFKDSLAKDLLAGSADDIRKFVLGLLERGLSPKTARRKLSAIRSFYQFVFGEGALPRDPSRHIHGPKAFKTLIRPITRGEVDQTLASLGSYGAQDIRNRALMLRAGLNTSDDGHLQRGASARQDGSLNPGFTRGCGFTGAHILKGWGRPLRFRSKTPVTFPRLIDTEQ